MTKSNSSTIGSIDLMKWICAWMVVTIHARPFINYSIYADLYISQGICRFAVPLFFASSGYLLFRKIQYPILSNRKANNQLILRYIIKTCQRYITWSAIYYLFQIQYWAFNGMLTKEFILNQIRLFFLEASYGHLWYLLATIFAIPVVYLLMNKGRKYQCCIIAFGWFMRCVEYTYDWTGFFSNQFKWIHQYCDVVSNVLFCAIPMILIGVLAVEGYKRSSNQVWLIKAIFWTVIYFTELTLAFYLSKNKIHFEFLLSCPMLIYNVFCWILTSDFQIPNPFVRSLFRLGSEWIYYIHWLAILIFSLFSGDTGVVRFLVVCLLCLLSSVGYVFFEYKRGC